jgi:drug/metabolite transporter (DMT)-like permease
MQNVWNTRVKSERQQALLALIGAATLWSLGGLFIKSVNWNPVAIAGMRSAIAALLMWVIKRKFSFNWSATQLWGAVAYASTVILFVTANKMTTAANAILLQYSAPIYVALLSSWFLGERTTKLDWVTIGVVFCGMILFFVDNLSVGNMLGNIIAIFSGVAFAALTLLSRKQKDGSPLESLFLGNVLTAIIGLPFMFQSMPSTKSWMFLGLLGVVQLGFSYILYAFAMKHVTALEGILIPIIEPVLNPIWVLIFLHEVPSRWAIVGGMIVLAGVTARCVIAVIQEKQRVKVS